MAETATWGEGMPCSFVTCAPHVVTFRALCGSSRLLCHSNDKCRCIWKWLFTDGVVLYYIITERTVTFGCWSSSPRPPSLTLTGLWWSVWWNTGQQGHTSQSLVCCHNHLERREESGPRSQGTWTPLPGIRPGCCIWWTASPWLCFQEWEVYAVQHWCFAPTPWLCVSSSCRHALINLMKKPESASVMQDSRYPMWLLLPSTVVDCAGRCCGLSPVPYECL